MDAWLTSLLQAAVRAPSGDNTQPWRFVVDAAAGRVEVHLDETRDPSPMNAGQRMARIALGAAVENLLRTAQSNGWDVELEEATRPALAVVRVRPGPDAVGAPARGVAERVTNRQFYDGRPVPPDTLAWLAQQTPPLGGVTTHWISDRERITALAALVGQADALMFGEPSMRRAFFSKVRFDAPYNAAVEDGLSLASLELSAPERLGLRLMRRLPGWLLRFAGVLRSMGARARKLVESASGLCLIVAPDADAETDLLVGRAVQRAWLALTERELAVQPMMSLLVLENAADHGPAELVTALGREHLAALREGLRTLAPEIGDGRPAFLMRFGYAPPPSGRTGRLSVQVVSTETALAPQPTGEGR
jgi:hypothetical protein